MFLRWRRYQKFVFDCCWYLFYDVRRVVGLCVDVLWIVVWLSVRTVGTVCKVEGDVQVFFFVFYI